jgi:hypothetical protein
MKVKCSEQQYKSFMKRREPYLEGAFLMLEDENRKPLGKIQPHYIEYVAPDGSPSFDGKAAPAPAPKAKAVEVVAKQAPAYKSKTYGKKK